MVWQRVQKTAERSKFQNVIEKINKLNLKVKLVLSELDIETKGRKYMRLFLSSSKLQLDSLLDHGKSVSRLK